MRAGIHDVNKPLESDRHPGLIIHDSRGFEAGSDRELTLLLEFLRQRLGHADSKERLDAIWFVHDFRHLHDDITLANCLTNSLSHDFKAMYRS